ncbi:MAG: hypothetical protein F4227_04915 [Gammaproteobacteria bacterium]|nr:hypothetical protein [Gammaproteobacteria bacterium]MYF02309.1 hypothetical protein [Gammaproteobacteria bacterium]MYI77875.1 hypothetical protein [Gammaproteobacteria bacterium]
MYISPYRRLEHLHDYSNRASFGALLVAVVCALFFYLSLENQQVKLAIAWRPSGIIWLSIGCYFLGVFTSFLFVRKLKRIVKASKEKWQQDETVQESS